MPKLKKHVLFLTIVVLITLLLAACGDTPIVTVGSTTTVVPPTTTTSAVVTTAKIEATTTSAKSTTVAATTSAVTTAPATIAPLTAALEPIKHGDGGYIRGVDWSPDGKTFASGGKDGAVRIWDAITGKPVQTLSTTTALYALQWSPDNKSMITASVLDNVRIWNLQDKSFVSINPENNAYAVAWSPDSKLVVVATGGTLTSEVSAIIVYDTAGKIVRRLDLPSGFSPRDNGFNSVSWSPDGSKIVAGSSTNDLYMWNATDGKIISTLNGHTKTVTGVEWSPDGKTIASVGGSELRFWDANGKELPERTAKIDGKIYDVSWSKDGKKLATLNVLAAGGRVTVSIWEATTSKQLRTIKEYDDFNETGSVAWSPDNRRIITGSEDGKVRIWDAGS